MDFFYWLPQDIINSTDSPLKLALTLGYGFGELFKLSPECAASERCPGSSVTVSGPD